ncbi:MAG: AAA family ATPase, partial [Candidatus Poseidonia sp.]|nr:AAA family ATPase [Poseidonia sp.]
MFSRPQEKILRYLGRFPESLEKAWDVPRDLSLPGLSEAMGVVRSGLNQPLGFLESKGFISVRVAHVIGGGSRRRQVYHITQQGRVWLAEHPPEEVLQNEAVAPSSKIFGREDELRNLEQALAEEHAMVVGGLSGIGKTTLVRALVQRSPFASRPLHWADVNELSDINSILAAWFPEDNVRLSDREAQLERANYGDACFVLDDLHALSSRHSDDVLSLLSSLKEHRRTVIVIGRYPLSLELDWKETRLTSLEPEEAMHMLGEHLEEEERLSISRALGGHPMALKLYREGDPLPEAGSDIQTFVQETMLNPLDTDEISTLDHLILNPSPLPV